MKNKLANELKKLFDEIQNKQQTAKTGGSVPIAQSQDKMASLLAASYPNTWLSDIVLSDSQLEILKQVLLEYRQQSKLRE